MFSHCFSIFYADDYCGRKTSTLKLRQVSCFGSPFQILNTQEDLVGTTVKRQGYCPVLRI